MADGFKKQTLILKNKIACQNFFGQGQGQRHGQGIGYARCLLRGDFRNFNPVQRIFLINKITLCAMDIFYTLSINLSTKISNKADFFYLNLCEMGCRLAEVCRGFYLYRTDPNINQGDCLKNIALNVLNIYRLGMILLNPLQKNNLNLDVVAFIDTCIRIGFLFRTELMGRFLNFLQNPNVDLTARMIARSTFSILSFLLGLGMLAPVILSIPHKGHLYALIAGLGVLTAISIMVVKYVVHEVFNHIGFRKILYVN